MTSFSMKILFDAPIRIPWLDEGVQVRIPLQTYFIPIYIHKYSVSTEKAYERNINMYEARIKSYIWVNIYGIPEMPR